MAFRSMVQAWHVLVYSDEVAYVNKQGAAKSDAPLPILLRIMAWVERHVLSLGSLVAS